MKKAQKQQKWREGESKSVERAGEKDEDRGDSPTKNKAFWKKFFSEKVALDIGRNVTKKGKICNYLTRQKPTHNGSKFSTLDPFLDKKKLFFETRFQNIYRSIFQK